MLRFKPNSLIEYHSIKKRVSYKQLHCNIQTSLFEQSIQRIDHRRYLIGDFFEFLTIIIFGGKRNAWNENDETHPDVVNNFKIYESKSIAWNSELKITQYQVDKYNNEFKNVYYVVYKYMIDNPMKIIGGLSIDKYFKCLSKNVGFCIVFPLKLINLLLESTNGKYQSYYNYPEPTIRISSTFLKLLLISPEPTLQEGFWIKTSNFRFRKRFLPDNIYLNENKINPFPILLIEERYNKKGAIK